MYYWMGIVSVVAAHLLMIALLKRFWDILRLKDVLIIACLYGAVTIALVYRYGLHRWVDFFFAWGFAISLFATAFAGVIISTSHPRCGQHDSDEGDKV